MAAGETSSVTGVPARPGITLAALILAAFVCNLNLAVANVALPAIGTGLDASQTQLTLIALGCSLGLAMSVLYLGAIGDRYGRKRMLVLGLAITIPAALACAWAPSAEALVAARVLTGVAAGMAYPTTLALVTALWAEGPARTKAIALWSGVSGGSMVLGPVIAGFLLEAYWWGSVFLIVVPVALVALVLVVLLRSIPAHVEETTDPVDHLGGVVSVFMIASFVLGIGTISSGSGLERSLGLIAIALVLVVVFVVRQRRAASPLYDLTYAARTLFWVPAIAGMIVFGALVGAMFVGQQFLQDVLGYSTASAGLAIIPATVGMVAVAALSGRLVIQRGSRFTLLAGFAFLLPAFLVMLVAWREGTSYLWVGLAYLLVGMGAGLALTPASRSLTGSVPVTRAGMASGTADLQRDLGGAVMQALLGTFLTLGYAASIRSALAESPEASTVSEQTQATLAQSFSGAEAVAARYPEYQQQIVEAARQSFLDGANWAYAAAAIAVLVGALIVVARMPGKDAENALVAQYQAADTPAPGSSREHA